MAFVPIVQTVEVYGGAGLLRDGVHGAHMVIVTVGQKNSPTAQVVFLQIVQNEIALVTGVDDGAVQGGFVGDHIAVGLQLAHRQGLDQHGSYSSFVSSRMVKGPSFSERTSIFAPKTPVSTRKPRARHSAITRS